MWEKFTLAFIITILLQLFAVGNPNSFQLPEDDPPQPAAYRLGLVYHK
ncbi:MAG: hypothetical protein AB4352_16620 [Hormoscilla sp.]